jgi:hypothetical protein
LDVSRFAATKEAELAAAVNESMQIVEPKRITTLIKEARSGSPGTTLLQAFFREDTATSGNSTFYFPMLLKLAWHSFAESEPSRKHFKPNKTYAKTKQTDQKDKQTKIEAGRSDRGESKENLSGKIPWKILVTES